jgi:hypothetical protein
MSSVNKLNRIVNLINPALHHYQHFFCFVCFSIIVVIIIKAIIVIVPAHCRTIQDHLFNTAASFRSIDIHCYQHPFYKQLSLLLDWILVNGHHD